MTLLSLFNAPANTNGYFIAGYTIFFVVMLLYLGSLIIRDRNLKQEYELLVELDKED